MPCTTYIHKLSLVIKSILFSVSEYHFFFSFFKDCWPRIQVLSLGPFIFHAFEYRKIYHSIHSSNVRIYKPHYDYQNFSPLANGTDLSGQKYDILQTHLALKLVLNGTKVSLMGSLMGFVMGL